MAKKFPLAYQIHLVYTVRVRLNRGKGYLVISALMIVAVAMFYSTATLASLRALQQESGWSQSRTQELAAARSATALLVSQFNQAGQLDNVGGTFQGEINSLPYTATLVQDPNQPELFRLTARVGNSTSTRVIRQEPRVLHTAFARSGPVGLPTLHLQKTQNGDWEELPAPPQGTGDLARIPAIASNFQGELYAFRFGERLHPGVPTPFLSRYDVESNTWADLPPIPYDFMQSLTNQDGWTMESYARQTVLAANDRAVFTIVGPNHLLNRNLPTEVAEFFLYDIKNEQWSSVDRPPVSVYDSNGGLDSNQDEVVIHQLAASDGQFLMELSGQDDVSTVYRLSEGGWSRLPAIPTSNGFGKIGSLAAGPNGEVSALVRDPSGDLQLLNLEDGRWSAGSTPGNPGIQTVGVDSEGKNWLQNQTMNKAYQLNQDVWEEKELPSGNIREVEIGARPSPDLHYYQTTTRY